MDLNNLRGLVEAFNQVHAPQEVDEKFSMAADPSKPEAPRSTRKAENKKGMSLRSRAIKAVGTQTRQDKETGIREENIEELYKGKHGQSEKEYQDSRSDAGKMISGDSKRSGAAYSSRAVKNTGPNPAGGKERPKAQGRMGAKDREYLAYRKANMKKEELEATGIFTAEEIERILEIMGE